MIPSGLEEKVYVLEQRVVALERELEMKAQSQPARKQSRLEHDTQDGLKEEDRCLVNNAPPKCQSDASLWLSTVV